jgi:hypothetical protein
MASENQLFPLFIMWKKVNNGNCGENINKPAIKSDHKIANSPCVFVA